jgi:AcrR family transcriptional regulator
MTGPRKRTYDASRRREGAARTRAAVATAALQLFEANGWSGTTVHAVAVEAGTSLKTVEAVFGTKAVLLEAAVDLAIRGDLEPVEMVRREAIKEMEAAPDARRMLDLHAAHLRRVNGRSAGIAFVVEQASGGDMAVARLWERMNRNRTFAVGWAAKVLLGKPGRRSGLRRRDVESAFWVALDWGTYRTLTKHAGLSPDAFEAWLRRYYRASFL